MGSPSRREGGVKSSQARPSQAKSSQVESNQGKASQVKVRSGQARGQVKSSQGVYPKEGKANSQALRAPSQLRTATTIRVN